jgi:hypothetical protein
MKLLINNNKVITGMTFYDHIKYPGLIVKTKRSEVQVQCMEHTQQSASEYQWPKHKDICWYFVGIWNDFNNVLIEIPTNIFMFWPLVFAGRLLGMFHTLYLNFASFYKFQHKENRQ